MITGLPIPIRALGPANEPGLTVIAGRLTGAGAAAPVVTAGFNAPGVVTTRTGVGAYTLKLPGSGALSVIGPVFQVLSPDAGVHACNLVSWTPSTRIAAIQIFDAGVAAELETDETLTYIAISID